MTIGNGFLFLWYFGLLQIGWHGFGWLFTSLSHPLCIGVYKFRYISLMLASWCCAFFCDLFALLNMLIAVGPWPVRGCRRTCKQGWPSRTRLSYYSGCNRSLFPCGITKHIEKRTFGPLFVYSSERNNIQKISTNNKLDRKHPKNTIKKPRKTHPFPQAHAQKTREVSATFLHSKLVRSERVKSTTPKSFLVHYCRKEWSEPVKLC